MLHFFFFFYLKASLRGGEIKFYVLSLLRGKMKHKMLVKFSQALSGCLTPLQSLNPLDHNITDTQMLSHTQRDLYTLGFCRSHRLFLPRVEV